MKSALLELEEIARSTMSYFEALEANPNQLEAVEKRLGEIDTLKKRFGTDIEQQKKRLNEKLDTLNSLDEQIDLKNKALRELGGENRTLIQEITQKRRSAAQPFAHLVIDELRSLNLAHAKFEVFVGDEFNNIGFSFSANPGHEMLPLAACASGGELSRLLLAIKTLLSDGVSTLVFDEIDSNVGGYTALSLGQKLKQLGRTRQVICVTHFVQVAKCAGEHFLVSKIVQGSKAYTSLAKLNEKEKEIEYHRMLGQTL